MITPAIEIALRMGRPATDSYRKLAKELGVSAGYLHQVSNNKRKASKELLDALGLERVVKTTYRRKRTNSTNGTELATR